MAPVAPQLALLASLHGRSSTVGHYQDALHQYQEITEELASLQMERGDSRMVAIRNWQEGWMNSGGEGVTIRRENAKLASATMDMRIEQLSGQIEAAQTRLRFLDQYIAYLQNQAQTASE